VLLREKGTLPSSPLDCCQEARRETPRRAALSRKDLLLFCYKTGRGDNAEVVPYKVRISRKKEKRKRGGGNLSPQSSAGFRPEDRRLRPPPPLTVNHLEVR